MRSRFEDGRFRAVRDLDPVRCRLHDREALKVDRPSLLSEDVLFPSGFLVRDRRFSPSRRHPGIGDVATSIRRLREHDGEGFTL